MNKLPTVSILIPTLNAASVLEKCCGLRIEVFSNPLKAGEAGKAVLNHLADLGRKKL